MQTTSIQLQTIRDSLSVLIDSCYHYVALSNAVPPYIVLAEDGDNYLAADDHHAERAVTGTVDLYTKQENDPLKDSIEEALENAGASWYFNSFQYETETGLLHFEWVWEVA